MEKKGPKKAGHWEYYEEYFDLKGNFLVELANIMDSTKNICNESDNMKLHQIYKIDWLVLKNILKK